MKKRRKEKDGRKERRKNKTVKRKVGRIEEKEKEE